MGRVAGRTAARTTCGGRRCRCGSSAPDSSRGRTPSDGCRGTGGAPCGGRHAAALVGGARLHPALRPQGSAKKHLRYGQWQCARHRRGPRLRHPPHRAGLWQDAISGFRGSIDWHLAAGGGRQRTRPPCAPVFDFQPAQRRAPGLQQPVTHRQTGARRQSRKPGAWRGVQLPVRPGRGRHRGRDRPIWRVVPDAQPPALQDRDDLHRHWQRAHAGDDGVAQAPARLG